MASLAFSGEKVGRKNCWEVMEWRGWQSFMNTGLSGDRAAVGQHWGTFLSPHRDEAGRGRPDCLCTGLRLGQDAREGGGVYLNI